MTKKVVKNVIKKKVIDKVKPPEDNTKDESNLDEADGCNGFDDDYDGFDEQTESDIANRLTFLADNPIDVNRKMDAIETKADFETEAYKITNGDAKSWEAIAELIRLCCEFAIKFYGLEKYENVIKWTVNFINENYALWIAQKGGWAAVFKKAPTTDVHYTRFLGGIALGATVTGLTALALFKLRAY